MLMEALISFEEIEDKIIILRGQKVLLDRDVAALYGVETRGINKSVRNNPDEFPKGCVIELNDNELKSLRWRDSATNLSKSRVLPKVFTEEGLYTIATVLRSACITEVTISIIETFAKLREPPHTLNNLPDASGGQQRSLLEKSGDLSTDSLGNNPRATGSETTIELNSAVLKVERTVKRRADKK